MRLLILACDTSTDHATFALGDEYGDLLGDVCFKHNRDLSQRFYLAMDDLLSSSERTFDDVDVLAVGVGPGSFTGVRVAVTTFKTLAQASGKKLVEVSTLRAYAAAVPDAATTMLVAILPSRRGEVYYQIFNNLQEIDEPTVARHDELEELLLSAARPIVLCGQVAALPAQFDSFPRFEQFEVPPSALIRLSADKIRADDFASFITLSPTYAAPPAISQHRSR